MPRDFVEFPSQFNEHWALNPEVFANYAKHYKTGQPMPAELAAKIKKSQTFNQGYMLTELLARRAARYAMAHACAPMLRCRIPTSSKRPRSKRCDMALSTVPPRYRSSYFMHIWGNGYGAGYYAYLWCEMLDDDAYQWFEENGGLTRANGDRLRKMILSRGNVGDYARLYRDSAAGIRASNGC